MFNAYARGITHALPLAPVCAWPGQVFFCLVGLCGFRRTLSIARPRGIPRAGGRLESMNRKRLSTTLRLASAVVDKVAAWIAKTLRTCAKGPSTRPGSSVAYRWKSAIELMHAYQCHWTLRLDSRNAAGSLYSICTTKSLCVAHMLGTWRSSVVLTRP